MILAEMAEAMREQENAVKNASLPAPVERERLAALIMHDLSPEDQAEALSRLIGNQ